MKRRKGLLVAICCIFFFSSASAFKTRQIQTLCALPATRTLDELWGVKTKEFLGKDYAQYKNKKQIGKYYKVGIMGHRQVMEIENVKLIAGIIEDFIPSTAVGTYTDMSIVESTTYSVTNEITSSVEVKVGVVEMTSAMVNLEDIGSVGTNTSMTKEYKLASTNTYATTLSKTFTVNKTVNLSAIPSDKISFSISRVACYLQFDVKASYTEEQNFFGKWGKISNTIREKYFLRYYIADIQTFCYNDNTFGNTIIGTFPLQDIKAY